MGETRKKAGKLVIVDGYSLLFRAFFAPGPYLSTADGRPTGAVYGFANSLLSLIDQEKPDSFYVAWDPPGNTFRHEAYEQYKAHRPEAGADLKQQIPVARALVDAMGVAAAEVPGFEADDLIGTLATRGVKEGYEVVIVTGDSDQLQLVGDGVIVRMTRRGVTDMANYDRAAVCERYGIPPERVPDYKALVGDTSDNIPGVPGVGDKTASSLLQQYGSLDSLLEHIEELPTDKRMGRVRDSLAAHVDQARKSRELATIHCEAPFEGPIQRYEPTPDEWAKVRAMFEDLEFRSLMRRLPEPESGAVEDLGSRGVGEPGASGIGEAPPVERVVIESSEQLAAALGEVRKAGILALSVHTDGELPTRAALLGLAFAAAPERGYYVRIQQTCDGGPETGGLFGESPGATGYSAPLERFADVLVDEKIQRIAHNAKQDEILLEWRGAKVGAFAFDTMVAAYLLAPGRSSYPLPDLLEEYLRLKLPPESESMPEEHAAELAARLLVLREPLRRRLSALELNDIMYRIEMPLISVLAEMERVGVPVDRAWLGGLSAEMAGKIDAIALRIYELAGEEFLIGSTQQLQRILFEKLKLTAGKKIKTGYSTAAGVLESLAAENEICARILEYRELTKLKSTYADALPKLIHPQSGRLHTSLNQTVAATGRLSSSDPNLQNIPVRSEVGREIRKAFVAPEGQVLLSCDYSQIELRIFAHITRDPEMVRAFEADEDIHAATATRLFGVDLEGVTPEMRRRAKTVNFAVIYGQSDFGLASTLGIPNAEAKAFIASYFAQFPGVQRYTQETLEQARARGYVQTLLGRRRYLPEIRSGNFNIRQGAERAAVNMPIQGTAADIMKLAMIDVHRKLPSLCHNCVLLLQVHDELVFTLNEADVPLAAPAIVHLMEDAYRLDVRLRVDAKAGRNWAAMSPLRLD